MRICLLAKITHFGRTPRIDTYHYAMFHGIAKRAKGDPNPLNSIEHPASAPVELILDDYRLNKVISPLLNLIVTDDLASELALKHQIVNTDVVVKGVATIEYAEGSMKHWENPKYRDKGGTPESILRRAADKSKKLWNGPPLKELVPHDGETLAEHNESDAFSTSVHITENEQDYQILATRNGLRDFGFIWSDRIHCFRPDVFECLAPHVNRDYFAIKEIKI